MTAELTAVRPVEKGPLVPSSSADAAGTVPGMLHSSPGCPGPVQPDADRDVWS
jgi:hypothetical protein